MVRLDNPAEIGEGSETVSGQATYVYSASTLRRRIDSVRARMDELGVDSLLVSHPLDRRYLTGFSGEDMPPLDSAGFFLISPDDLCLITDGRYPIQAEREIPPDLGVAIAAKMGKLIPRVAEQVAARGCKRLGFDTAHLLHMWWDQLGKALPDSTLVPLKGVVEPLRMAKDEDEIRLMRKAISISDRAFDIVSRQIRVGWTEKQVAWEIERMMRELGADERAFSTIVGSGPNGAMAHATPSDRPIQEGEPIVIDMGARVDGYNSDMTRTIILGEPADKFREIYNIVLRANLEAERNLKPGISGPDADALSRNVIQDAGYGDYFNHGLGHGIGLEVHEGPSLGKTSEDTMPENAITSVEPGIYIEGWGGVRIEDLVLFRPDGVEVLTQADKHGEY